MYAYKEIETVHLEVTSKCNVSCGMCARNWDGGPVNPRMSLVELSLGDIKRIFIPSFVKQLRCIYVCGSFGDGLMAKDMLPIFTYFRETNPNIILRLHTHGSGRNVEWWKKLAELGNIRVVFGLDGLEDTNHLYRKGANWKLIMRNTQTFIDNGGMAEWQFIIFKHNQHQIEQASKLANEMGFTEFKAIKTSRFVKRKIIDSESDSVIVMGQIDKWPMRNQKGDIEYYLEMPDNENQRHDVFSKEIPAEWEQDLAIRKSPIKCNVQAILSIYVDAWGKVFPCCWTGSDGLYSKGGSHINRLIEAKGYKNDGKKFSLKEIVETFISEMPKYWKPDENRLYTCGVWCNQGLDHKANLEYKIPK